MKVPQLSHFFECFFRKLFLFMFLPSMHTLGALCKEYHFSHLLLYEKYHSCSRYLQKQGFIVRKTGELAVLDTKKLSIQESKRSFSQKAWGDVCICFLSLYDDKDAASTLQRLLEEVPFLLIIEWHAPQRNIDYFFAFFAHIYILFCKRKSYKKFAHFMGGVGMQKLIQQMCLENLLEKRTGFGFWDCFLLKKTDKTAKTFAYCCKTGR